ncbi:hypothetical protein ACW4YW_10675 [Methylobacillus pratensis]
MKYDGNTIFINAIARIESSKLMQAHPGLFFLDVFRSVLLPAFPLEAVLQQKVLLPLNHLFLMPDDLLKCSMLCGLTSGNLVVFVLYE